jgi:hypothetical protein
MRDDDLARAYWRRGETASPRREAVDRDGVNPVEHAQQTRLTPA